MCVWNSLMSAALDRCGFLNGLHTHTQTKRQGDGGNLFLASLMRLNELKLRRLGPREAWAGQNPVMPVRVAN